MRVPLENQIQYLDLIRKAVHTENNGLSAARNCGLNIASGDYTGFVDSDDFIEPDMYELLYQTLTEHNADICACSRYMEYEDTGRSVSWARKKKITDLTPEQAMEMMTQNFDFNVAVWDKLYRSELFSDIRFPVGKLYEDNYVTVQVLHLCSRICYIPVPLYHYTQRSESLMHIGGGRAVRDAVDAKRFMRDFIREYHPAVLRSADIWLTTNYIAALKWCLKNGYPVSSDLRDEVLKGVRRDWLCCLKKRNINVKIKAQMLLLRTSFRLYCAVYILWKRKIPCLRMSG